MTKSFFRCTECKRYTLQKKMCPHCGARVIHPNPARFSFVKAKRYRDLVKKLS